MFLRRRGYTMSTVRVKFSLPDLPLFLKKLALLIPLLLFPLDPSRGGGWKSIGPTSGLHASVLHVAYDPSNSRIYATTDSGYIRQVTDSTWATVLANYCNYPPIGYPQCYSYRKIWKHPYVDSVWFLGTNWLEFEPGEILYRGPTAEGPWQIAHIGMFLGTNFNLTFRPDTVSTLYANLEHFVMSTDTGQTWFTPTSDQYFWGAPFIALDENSPRSLFTASYGSVHQSTNGGSSWTPILDSFYAHTASCLVRSDTIVLGASQWPDSGFILFSSNAGNSWSEVLSDRQVYSLLRHPEDTDMLFAGGIGEILRSSDGGASWTMYNNTLPHFAINHLAFIRNPDTLYAATGGAGILQVYQSVVSVNENESSTTLEVALLQNYPNPFNPATAIRYHLPAPSHVTIEVFTILGQRAALLLDEAQQAGAHSIVLRANGWSSGVYFVRLNAGGQIRSRPIILVR